MPSRRSVGRNLGALALGEIIGLLITLVGNAYLARTLGSHDFGVIGFALAVLVYFSLIADWGLDIVAVRQVAGGEANLPGYVATITAAKLAMAGVAFLGLVAFVFGFPLPGSTRTVIFLYGLGLFVQPFMIGWVFQGMERLELVAIATLLQRVAYVAALPIFVHHPQDTPLVPLATVGASVLAALFLSGAFVRQVGWTGFGTISRRWLDSARVSTPNALSRIFRTVSYNFDVVALGFLAKDTAMVGWYVAAYRIIMTLTGGVGLYVTSIYPVFSRIAGKGPADLASFLGSCLRLTAAAVLPIAVGGTALAELIMHLIYGAEYAPGVLPLKILFWQFALVALIANLRYTLLALERLGTDAWIVGCGAGVNILLNFWLIPRYALVGAAVATLASETLVVALLWIAVSRALGSSRLLGALLKPGLAAAGMGAALFVLEKWLHPILSVSSGGAIYAVSLLAMRGLSWEDIKGVLAGTITEE